MFPVRSHRVFCRFLPEGFFSLPARFCVALGCACCLACLPAASVSAAACLLPIRVLFAAALLCCFLAVTPLVVIVRLSDDSLLCATTICAATTTTKTTTSSSHLIDLGSWVVVSFLAILIQVYLNLYL